MYTNENELGIDFDVQSDIDINEIPITPRVEDMSGKSKKRKIDDENKSGPSLISQEYVFDQNIYFPNNSGEIDDCFTSLINDYVLLEEDEHQSKSAKQRRKMREMLQEMEIFQAQLPSYDWNQLAANYLANLDADLFIICCHLLAKMSKPLEKLLSAPDMKAVIEDTIITSCCYFHSVGILMLSKLTPEWLLEVISQRLDGAGT